MWQNQGQTPNWRDAYRLLYLQASRNSGGNISGFVHVCIWICLTLSVYKEHVETKLAPLTILPCCLHYMLVKYHNFGSIIGMELTIVWPQQTGRLWCLSRNFNGIRDLTTPKRFNSPSTKKRPKHN